MGGILDLTKYPFVKEEMDPFATINSWQMVGVVVYCKNINTQER
jgi:hypothetical protein